MKLTPRDKKYLIAGAVVAALLLMLKYAILPVYDKVSFQKKDIALKEITLDKYLKIIEKQAEVQKALSLLTIKSRKIEQSLLKGGTPSLAAADIQKIADTIAEQSSVTVKSVKVMDPGEQEEFITIPIQITFESDLTKTCDFIERIEKSPKLLTISELKIRVKNRRQGGKIAVTLKIVGFMKNKESQS